MQLLQPATAATPSQVAIKSHSCAFCAFFLFVAMNKKKKKKSTLFLALETLAKQH